jgi:hypothetical protein
MPSYVEVDASLISTVCDAGSDGPASEEAPGDCDGTGGGDAPGEESTVSVNSGSGRLAGTPQILLW